MRHWWCFTPRKCQTAGFTLIELLVSTIIAGIAISGLLYMVVQLLPSNQREFAQSETQRDMQMALDFMSSELQEAVYVYGGDCLQGQTTPTFCPGIANYVPVPANSVPILAFWKLELLPKQLQEQCKTNLATANVPCDSGRTYTLVVYSLSKALSVPWLGKARIIRYAMTQFDINGNPNPNYVSPAQIGVGFALWPFKNQGGNLTNLQTSIPTANQGNTAALVDFVDDTARPSVGDDNITCPTNYVVSPSLATLNNYVVPPFNSGDKNIRSFYACVRGETAYNQDVFIFLRGNAYGRAGIQGINDNSFLPRLQTQVPSHGIVSDLPPLLR